MATPRQQIGNVVGFGQVRSSPAARPIDAYTGAPQAFQGKGFAGQIADALGLAGQSVAQYKNIQFKEAQAEEKRKEAEARQEEKRLRLKAEREAEALDASKAGYYAAQFAKDRDLGLVSMTQVGEMYPDKSPIVVANITEILGKQFGEQFARERMQTILEDEAMRLDETSRTEFFNALRQDLFTNVEGREFFGAGALAAMDAVINEYESRFNTEAAAYHAEVQAKDFASGIRASLLSSENPTEAMRELDASFSQKSSLSNLRRKEITVDTVIGLAIEQKDVKMLSAIPDTLLNADLKAKVQEAEIRVSNLLWQDYSRGIQVEENNRRTNTRAGKLDIIDKLLKGEEINYNDYRDNQEVFQFAVTMQDTSLIPRERSRGAAVKLSSDIFTAATSGDFSQLDNPDGTEDGMIDAILARNDLTPADKIALIDKVPTLFEGADIINAPQVTSNYNKYLSSSVQALTSSPVFGPIAQIKGINIEGEVSSVYLNYIEEEVMAAIEDGNPVPKGSALRKIIKEARSEASAKLSELQQMLTEGKAGEDVIDLSD